MIPTIGIFLVVLGLWRLISDTDRDWVAIDEIAFGVALIIGDAFLIFRRRK